MIEVPSVVTVENHTCECTEARNVVLKFLARNDEIIARPCHAITNTSIRFFSPLPSIEYEDIIGTVVGRFELLVSSVSIVGRDELE